MMEKYPVTTAQTESEGSQKTKYAGRERTDMSSKLYGYP